MTGKKGPKVEALVVSAIRRLQDAQGSTPREISNYIAQEYDVPGPEIKKQVQLALKRGVSFGILQRSKGGCYSCNRDFLAKQQPMETGDVEMKCRSRRRRARCRESSRKSRRGRASRCAKRSSRRSSRRSRKRSHRRSGCKRRRSSRRRCASRRGQARSRRRNRRRSRRRGKRCSSGGMIEMDAIISKQPPTRRDDSASRNESHSDRSSVSGSSDDRRMDNQDPQSITPPITHMD